MSKLTDIIVVRKVLLVEFGQENVVQIDSDTVNKFINELNDVAAIKEQEQAKSVSVKVNNKKFTFKQVATNLVDEVKLIDDFFAYNTYSVSRLNVYWKKFGIWKKAFKKLNPNVSEFTKDERKIIYTKAFKNFLILKRKGM